MKTRAEYTAEKLQSNELTADGVSDLALAFQIAHGCLKDDGKPGPATMAKAREVIEQARQLGTTPPVWVEGIDVSHHQHVLSDTALAKCGKFAFIKASEGTTVQDPSTFKHLPAMGKQGLMVGLYHFARPSSSLNGGQHGVPTEEAENFFQQWEKAVDLTGPLLPPVLDIEDDREVPPPAVLQDWCLTWCERVEALTGRKPIIYTYAAYLRDQLRHHDKLANAYRLWLADYRKNPPEVPDAVSCDDGEWFPTIWQYTGDGRIDGYTGSIDRNVFLGPLHELEEMEK